MPLYYCRAVLWIFLLHYCVQGDPMCDHSESCNVYKGKHVLNATDSNEATAQYQQPEVATAESGSPHWKIVYIISISTAVSFILLLIVVVTLVTVCVYRAVKSRARHGRLEDYAPVDNLEIDSFHSIPYRRDGLPECPISLYTDGGQGPRRKSRLSITWPPSHQRTHPASSLTSSSSSSTSPSPNMTWYYSRGQPLPVLPSSSTSTDGGLFLSHTQEHIQARKRRGMTVTEDGWKEVVASEAVPVDRFEEMVVRKYQDSMLGFHTEFMSLYSGTNKRVTVAQTRENRSKNCFSNFYPYDDCRVVLQPVPVYGHKTINSEHSDYINASYIDGFSRPRKFITTQVPLPHTVVDFWQMVWQEKAACLVLLSLAKEEGRGSPGERYCSDDVGTWCIGPFLVSTTAKTQCAHHTIRHISVQVPGSAPVEVCQLQLTNLSRQSVSYVASTLLAFHHRFTEFCPTLSTKPTVVHCSTGAGLSGVFVAVDRLIEEMWAGQGGGVNVWGVVNSLRRQRPRMVATLEQYVLVHEVILEMIKWGCTEIPVCELTNANTDFGLEGEGEGESVLEKLFKAAGPVKPDPGREEEQGAGRGGCLPCAHPLWISHSARGILAQSRTVPYHRPVSISSYWPGSGWLVTRSPSHSSVSRFWRTVVNKKCSIIIDFSSKNKERYRYWPDGDGVSSATLIAGQYAIHRGREEGGEGRATGDLKTTSLTIENLLSGQTQVVTQMVVVEWTGEVTVQMCGAVDTILRAQNSTTHTPVLLHCNDGVSEVGVVSVVSVAVEQGVAEGLVDIPCAIRKIRTQLPTAIASLDEMELVLKTVTALLNRKLH